MAKLNHQKRGRPRPKALRRLNGRPALAEFDARRNLEEWNARIVSPPGWDRRLTTRGRP
jgi:hypothetical protein